MLGTANGALYPRIRASLHCDQEIVRRNAELMRAVAAASAAGMPPKRGPLWRGERVEGKPEGWRAGCAPVRCQHTDVLSANRRSTLADLEGRMPGRRATGGVFLWLLSLHKQRKWPARPQGEWKLGASSSRGRSRWMLACAGLTNKEKRASDRRQMCVRNDEPFRAGIFEIDLHARMRAGAFGIDHDALAERGMAHALTELQ